MSQSKPRPSVPTSLLDSLGVLSTPDRAQAATDSEQSGGKTEPTPPQQKPAALVRLIDITSRGSFSKSHLYNLIARGHFPDAAIRDGTRFTRWHSADVDAWFADPAGWIARAEGAKAALISDGAAQ